jgi:hypothetical protein
MAFVLTCIAAVAAVPALMVSDDEFAAYLGLNALVWSSAAMAVS